MKKKITQIILIFPFLVFSQTNLRLNYNLNAAGRNLSFTIGKVKSNENEIGFGLRYNINSLKHPDDQFNTFYRRLYATKTLHFLGIEGYYHKRIFRKLEKVKPFLFYNIQLTYSSTRNRSFLPYSYDVNGDVLYKEYINFLGPFLWIEQSVGIGYNAELNNNFFITSKLGFEVLLLNGENKLFAIYEKFTREFGYLFSVSIGYHFKTKKKKKM